MITDDKTMAYVNALYQKEEDVFTWALRYVAEPPIKGKITERKLKLCGIVKVSVIHLNQINQSYLEQRGKRISPIVTMTTPFCKWL